MQKKYYDNLKVRQLKIDQQVQGSLQVKRVNSIVQNYDPKFIGTIIVSKRANGEYYVMDGYHRSTSLKRLGIEEVYCEVHENLSLEDEAQYYLAYNKHRKNPKAVDDYKVSLTAGVVEVVTVNRILSELNIEVSESGFRSPRKALEVLRTYGLGITKKTIEIYVIAWGKKNLIGKYIKELAKFINDNEEQIDFTILTNKMKKYKFNEIDELINKYLISRSVNSAVKAFEAILYNIYNHGLPKEKRLEYTPFRKKAMNE
ncbi:MAG: hypothetical protein N3B21_16050 [Clostridia bacterium]|nr:hypothetical protein [Clostridia bacterium]